ncbi:MAG: thioredoxin [Bacteroidales bacterium]|jgi:thioredoxin|nr:thioredoxin [Bacteroidales bacterium]
MKVIELNSELFKSKIMDFEGETQWKFKGERPAVIDFYATWCGPCKATAPVMEQLAEKYDGKVDFYKVDVDKESDLSAMFRIQSIPSILFIPKQGTPKMQVGAMGVGQMDEAVKSIC